MICVVLCAGRGSRLGGLTNELPKPLLPVSDDKTILDTVFDAVTPHVDGVIVVAGYQKEALIRKVAGMANTEVHVVSDVDKWNNARSLWSALNTIDDDVFVANGDTLLHPSVAKTLVAKSSSFDVSLAVDTSHEMAEEEMKVNIDSNMQITHISKKLDPAQASGEYVGQSIIRQESVPFALRHLAATWSANPQDYYEDGYQRMIDANVSVGAVELPTTTWTEVDDSHDLEVARCLSWL